MNKKTIIIGTEYAQDKVEYVVLFIVFCERKSLNPSRW